MMRRVLLLPWRSALIIIGLSCARPSPAAEIATGGSVPPSSIATQGAGNGSSAPPLSRDQVMTATDSYLKHIYIMYFGIKSCSELDEHRTDGLFKPGVSVDIAGRILRSLDQATATVGIKADEVWAQIAPKAIVNAEALKWAPENNIGICARIGNIFKSDLDNVEHGLALLGADLSMVQKE